MKFSKSFVAPCLLACMSMFAGVAHAASSYQIKVLTVGSSAQYGVFAEAAYQLATTDGQPKHYTVKSNSTSAPYSWVADSRTKNGITVPNEYGNMWVVWSETTGNVWVYISVDSTVGVRAFQAVPRATLGLAALSSLPVSTTTNLFVWDDGSNDTAMDTGVYNAILSKPFTAANTDIRPEDALFATRRSLAALDPTALTGLGYGTGPTTLVGTAIQGEVTAGSKATPVNFELSFSTDSFGGKDPFSGSTVPAFVTIPVGAAPIVFIANKTDASGLGAATNITTAEALKLFDGDECDDSVLGGSSSIPVYPFLREPLSGTMNTTEFNIFRTTSPWTTSQEKNVGSNNPLNTTCASGGGKRERAIGTGDVVKGVNNQEDGIGYVFFSYEALNAKGSSYGGNVANTKYLELNGVDPIGVTTSYTGAIPVCGSVSNADFSCPVPAGSSTTGLNSFPNLRSGSYGAWSIYRVISDSNGQTNAQALVDKANVVADKTLPDFVPFEQACGASASLDEQGLAVYREHFTISSTSTTAASYGIAPSGGNDGGHRTTLTCGSRSLYGRSLGGSTEQGGDVGGTIVYTAAGHNPTATIETSPVHY
jgi:hypothetical protein